MAESSSPAVDDGQLELLGETARGVFASATATATTLGELGMFGLLTPEAHGGSGWLPVEAAVVAEAGGWALSALPGLVNLIGAAGASAAGLDAGALLGGQATAILAGNDRLSAERPGTVRGRIAGLGAVDAALIVIAAGSGELTIVETAADGVDVQAAATLDTKRPTVTVTLDDAAAVTVGAHHGRPIVDAATVLAAADTLGGLRRMARVVADHLTERVAFGRPIAAFQAIQHRLADLEVLQAGLGALVEHGAAALAGNDPAASRIIAAAQAYLANRVPAALDDCIQLSGGLGFTWEWPVHHALRRAVVNAAVPVHASDRLDLLTSGGDPEPPLDDTPAGMFRARTRQVIRDHAPYEAREGHRAPASVAQEAALRAYYRALYDHRLLGATWPADRGGDPAHHPIHELIVTEELIRARAPRPIDQVQLSSHVLLQFGSEEQKDRYLPRIRRADDIWCQLFSEPDAGSDLAGIKARATQQADGSWLLSGQKTWTTDGHWAQMGLALLRTDSGSTRHTGITAFAVPMDAPGLVVQPMISIGQAHEVNDVFLDGVVLAADAVVGPVGEGWRVAMSGLEIERFGVGGQVVLLDLLLDDVVTVARGLIAAGAAGISATATDLRIAELTADAQAAKAFIATHVQRVLADRVAEGDGPIAKILYTETYNRIARYGATIVEQHRPLPAAAADAGQRLTDAWLWSRALTISGGSSEIMRNIIAKRRLRLPGA